MTSSPTVSTVRSVRRGARIGLVLAVLLTAADLAVSFGELGGSGWQPIVLIGLGVLTIVAVPFAWRGSWPGAVVVAATRVAAALTAVPAFFDPELEAFAQVVAAVWIGLSVLVAALLLLPGRARR